MSNVKKIREIIFFLESLVQKNPNYCYSQTQSPVMPHCASLYLDLDRLAVFGETVAFEVVVVLVGDGPT